MRNVFISLVLEQLNIVIKITKNVTLYFIYKCIVVINAVQHYSSCKHLLHHHLFFFFPFILHNWETRNCKVFLVLEKRSYHFKYKHWHWRLIFLIYCTFLSRNTSLDTFIISCRCGVLVPSTVEIIRFQIEKININLWLALQSELLSIPLQKMNHYDQTE